MALKTQYDEAARRKNHYTAKVIIAPKLLSIVYKVWKEERVYSPIFPSAAKVDARMAPC